jgi:dTMP kinase
LDELKKEKSGFFVAFEGIDGSGKTTQARMLFDSLCRLGHKPFLGKEPTDLSRWGKKIRALKNSPRLDSQEELRLFTLDRFYDVSVNILPILEAGGIVILDRYIISSLAYQGALGIPYERLLALNSVFPWPDLTIILDLDLAHSQERLRARGTCLGDFFEAPDYLKKVREIFDALNLPALTRLDGGMDRQSLAHLILTLTLRELEAKLAKG